MAFLNHSDSNAKLLLLLIKCGQRGGCVYSPGVFRGSRREWDVHSVIHFQCWFHSIGIAHLISLSEATKPLTLSWLHGKLWRPLTIQIVAKINILNATAPPVPPSQFCSFRYIAASHVTTPFTSAKAKRNATTHIYSYERNDEINQRFWWICIRRS